MNQLHHILIALVSIYLCFINNWYYHCLACYVLASKCKFYFPAFVTNSSWMCNWYKRIINLNSWREMYHSQVPIKWSYNFIFWIFSEHPLPLESSLLKKCAKFCKTLKKKFFSEQMLLIGKHQCYARFCVILWHNLMHRTHD